MKDGMVIRSTGSWYDILTEDKSVVKGRLKGKFRTKNLKVTNPIAVGDKIKYEPENNEEQTVIITEILPRKNYIIRQSIHKYAHGQLMASNVDQCVLMITLKQPETSLGFIDRYLVATESFRIPTVLLFNKTDIYSDEETQQLNELIAIYEGVGYSCFKTSLEEHSGIDVIKNIFNEKITLLSGHSGVGKSSLLNTLNPQVERKVKPISAYYDKGTHTTTFAEMIEVLDNSWIIDSPGISELGLYEIDPKVLSHYFPEMRRYIGQCKFNDCQHIREPGCAVKKAFEEELIEPSRYYSYLSILEGDDFKKG